MKLIIVLAVVLVAVVAAEKEPVKIVRSDFHQSPEGSYGFGYETEDGIVREEVGEVKEVYNEETKQQQKVVVSRGSYAYRDDVGKVETINYYADETGYHADGPSVPKAP